VQSLLLWDEKQGRLLLWVPLRQLRPRVSNSDSVVERTAVGFADLTEQALEHPVIHG